MAVVIWLFIFDTLNMDGVDVKYVHIISVDHCYKNAKYVLHVQNI